MLKQQRKRVCLFWFIFYVMLLFPCFASVTWGTTTTEIQQWLLSHNTYRLQHGVPALIWSTTVAASAQAYADTCPSGHSGSVYGENLAWSTQDIGISSVVKLWYNEELLYDYSKPGFSFSTGHFTQVVWKNTTEIGCGFISGCTNGWANVWVCQYNPPGNYIGQFAANVFPKSFLSSGNSGGADMQVPAVSATIIVPIASILLLRK